MLSLQEELASMENRLTFARHHYNDSVMQYNTARETIPVVFVAGAWGLGREPLFELEDVAERAVPRVQFSV